MTEHGELGRRAKVLGGIPVWGTVPGSAADQMGLQGGDILLRVNGVQLKSPADLSGARSLFHQSLELDVLRCESLVRIVVPAKSANLTWIDELSQQVFGLVGNLRQNHVVQANLATI
jgi:membrane-associated protease RseP (regulator of RpoE activity)